MGKLTVSISDRAVKRLQDYRLIHDIFIADALIAASALDRKCSLLTRNQPDYRFIDGLRLPT